MSELCPKCETHPYDLLNQTHAKLALIASLIESYRGQRDGYLGELPMTGLYWFLSDAEDVIRKNLEHHKEA